MLKRKVQETPQQENFSNQVIFLTRCTERLAQPGSRRIYISELKSHGKNHKFPHLYGKRSFFFFKCQISLEILLHVYHVV